MPSRRRIINRLVLTFLIASVGVVLAASTASAQVKQSAGEMQRSSGERQGNDLNSQTQGRDSGMSSRRGSTRSGPRLPSEDDYDEKKKKKGSGWDSSRHSSESHDDDELDSDSAPTLGRACIYGVDDEVVYRPKGSWCRGDAPMPDEPREDESDESSSASPASDRRGPAAASAYVYPEVRRKKVKRKTSAGCLYGTDGEVLYAPATSDCVNGIGAPSRP